MRKTSKKTKKWPILLFGLHFPFNAKITGKKEHENCWSQFN
jgi:hypothetical protein